MGNGLLFGSKKATATAVGGGLIPALVTLVAILMSEYTRLPAEAIESVCTLLTITLGLALGTYNVGQGMADWGKEGRKYEV